MNILDLAQNVDRFPSAVSFLCGTTGTVEEVCVEADFVFDPASPYSIVDTEMHAVRQNIDVPITCATDNTRQDMVDMLGVNTMIGAEYLLLNRVGDLALTGAAIDAARTEVVAASPKKPVLYLRGSALKGALASDLVKVDRDGLYTAWGDDVVVLEGAYSTPLGTNLGFWSADVVVLTLDTVTEEIFEHRANSLAYYMFRPVLVAVSPCATQVITTI